MTIRLFKSSLLIILICLYFQGIAQFRRGSMQTDFEGPWILIHAQRIDGSRIIDRKRSITPFEYTFKKNNVIRIDSISYAKSTIENDLTIIDARHANRHNTELELISDSLLVITEKYDEYSMDKRNKFVYLKKDRYLKYLKTTPYFVLKKDSTIVANGHLFPSYESKENNYPLTRWLFDRVSPCVGTVTGYFIISKDKEVVDVQMVENRKFDKWDFLVTAIKGTSGKWDLPMEGYNYKVPFTLGATEDGKNIGITFKPNDFEWFTHDHLGLSGKQISALTSLFDRGTKYLETNNFEKAIADFTTCTAIDPFFLDAYYNRAYAYFQLKQTDNACKDWAYLRDLEQVKGTQLFEQNCKK